MVIDKTMLAHLKGGISRALLLASRGGAADGSPGRGADGSAGPLTNVSIHIQWFQKKTMSNKQCKV
jgi:hypothetical protein